MLKKTLVLATALGGLTLAVPTASAQYGNSSYWSYDGKTSYQTYQACEEAKRTRTIGGAAVGGALGAGVGALAGGNDTRNAIVGGVVGAIAGGAVGNNQVKCQEYSYHSGNRYPYGSTTQTSGYSSNSYGYQTSPQYSQYGHSGYSTTPTRTYSTNSGYYRTTQPSYTTRTYSTQSSGYPSGYATTRQTRTYSYSGQQGYGHSGYNNNNRYYGSNYPQNHHGHSNYGNHSGYGNNSGYYQNSGSYSHHTSQPYYGQTSQNTYSNYGSSYHQPRNERWTFDGRTAFTSFDACERARRDRTIASGGAGALAGAGIGALAGGDDGRNALVGAIAGGALGAYAGNRSVNCYQY